MELEEQNGAEDVLMHEFRGTSGSGVGLRKSAELEQRNGVVLTCRRSRLYDKRTRKKTLIKVMHGSFGRLGSDVWKSVKLERQSGADDAVTYEPMWKVRIRCVEIGKIGTAAWCCFEAEYVVDPGRVTHVHEERHSKDRVDEHDEEKQKADVEQRRE